MKKAGKVIGGIFLVFLLLIVLVLAACFIYQTVAQKKSRELIEKEGFLNLVSAGDYDMNIKICGNGKYKVIAMPGCGDAAFTVYMKQLSEHLNDNISLVAVSRPGYGVCSETDSDVTTEFIVESTRIALQNAGIEAPYILMPYSMSGIYATYWENTYPDELSGVIFINTDVETGEEIENWIEPPIQLKFLYKAGVFRVLNKLSTPDQESSDDPYKQVKTELSEMNLAVYSKSFMNEMHHFNSNMKTAWSSIQENDIPKIFISTYYQSVEDAKEDVAYTFGEADEQKAQELFDEQQSEQWQIYRKNQAAYIKKLGNCTEINIPGSRFIYEQKPDEVARVIEEFINGLS